MSDIFLKTLHIENYKCFENEKIEFAIPDGKTIGSGLNVLIGENGNGKTTILESINFLTQSSFSTVNKLDITDFRDHTKEIAIRGDTDTFECKSTIDLYSMNNWIINANGVEFHAKSRVRKAPGKLLSTPFEVHNYFLTASNYTKSDGSKGKPVDSRDKLFINGSISNGEINIFYFDKNRTRHITTGNYQTTFESICDDLNWKFLKSIDEEKTGELVKNITGEYFAAVLDIASKGVGVKIAEDVAEFFGNKEFEKIKIELLELLHPFTNAFFAMRDEDKLTQVKIKSLGSGIEMILTLLLLKTISNQSKGSIIYLIDEPELHLHPKAQEKLAKLLLEESKTKQIIISTHSPYMFSSIVSVAGKLLLFNRKGNKIEVADASKKKWQLFPWSPSWGEINFLAYDLPTVEFHNELYGYSEETKKSELENLPKIKTWTNALSGKDEQVSLSKYIRNAIHHPENRANPAYTDEELRSSIASLFQILS